MKVILTLLEDGRFVGSIPDLANEICDKRIQVMLVRAMADRLGHEAQRVHGLKNGDVVFKLVPTRTAEEARDRFARNRTPVYTR